MSRDKVDTSFYPKYEAAVRQSEKVMLSGVRAGEPTFVLADVDGPEAQWSVRADKPNGQTVAQTVERYFVYELTKVAEVVAPHRIVAVERHYQVSPSEVTLLRLPGPDGADRDRRILVASVHEGYEPTSGEGTLAVVSECPVHLAL